MVQLYILTELQSISFPFPYTYFALVIVYTRNLVTSRVTIEKSYGFGLYLFNAWNSSVITDSCFIRNNEYVSKYQRCIDPEYPGSCTGGNLGIYYYDFVLSDTLASSSSLERNNSEFWRGLVTVQSEHPLRTAGGLAIQVCVVNHEIHVTINNTVIAENGGILAGNVAINITRACYSQA